MKRLAWMADLEHQEIPNEYRLGSAPPMCVLAIIVAICDCAHLDGFAFASVTRLVAQTGVRADIVEAILNDLSEAGLLHFRYNASGTRLLVPAASLRPMYRLLGMLEENSRRDATT